MGRPKGSKNTSTKEKKTDKKIIPDLKEGTDIKAPSSDKMDSLKKLMNEVNRNAGRTVMKFASEEETPARAKFKNKYLNELTGGGFVHRRFNILWGPKSAGKTTLCYDVIAEAQKEGKICAFIDLEGTFDAKWAIHMGVDLSKLILGTGYKNAEEAMDDFIKFVKSGAVDLIVLDSVQAMSPKGEQETKKGVEKSLEDDTMALLARKLSQFFRISASGVYESKACIILVGQARTNLGGFVAFDQLSGGHALHHWSTMTLNVRRGAKSDDPTGKFKNKETGKTETEKIGFASNIKLEKRKVESKVEGTEITIPFYFDEGFGTGEKKTTFKRTPSKEEETEGVEE